MSDASDPADLRRELERIRAERDALRHQVEQLDAGSRTSGGVRGVAVAVMVALACVSFTGATVGVWAERSLLDNEVFARRAAPLGEDPAVQVAVSRWLTGQIMTVVNPEELFSDALGERGQILAVPLTAAVESFVQGQVDDFVRSDAFARLWAEATTRAHAAAVTIVEGESEVVQAEDDQIVVNLVPLIDAALARIGSLSPQLFGRTVDLPELSVEDLPATAQQRLSEALGRPVGSDFGVIVMDDDGQLAAAQDAVRLFGLVVWVLVTLSVVLVPLALWLSQRRRRTLLQLVFGVALGLVLVRRLGLRIEGDALELIPDGTTRAAAEAIASSFLDPLLDATAWMLWTLAAIAVVTLVTGPYRWAVAVRRGGARVASIVLRGAGAVGARAGDERTVAWLRTNTAALQVGGLAVAVVGLLAFDLSWWGLLGLLVLLAAYESGVWWLGQSVATGASVGGPGTEAGATA